MKERPILFSGPMVRAILEGRKTMTRRVIKPQAQDYGNDILGQQQIYAMSSDGYDPTAIRCPYGGPGDRLWVRETWSFGPPAGGSIRAERVPLYQASDDSPFGKWKPSIFMPRWASRITLEIVTVRVEMLQAISEEDAIKEGVNGRPASQSFSALWDSINGKKHPWKSNPFVWVVEFKRA